MRKLIRTMVVLLSGLCLCGCKSASPGPNQGTSARAGVAYVHPNSKFSFPEQIGNFQFVGSRTFDRDGKDISVGYNSPTPVVATVFVYPAGKNPSQLPTPPATNAGDVLISHEFRLLNSTITKAHPEARLISEVPCEIIQGGNHFKGKKGVYSMKYRFGISDQDCFSELYLFLIEPGAGFLVSDPQFVEYRITYPAAVLSRATNEISSFLAKLTWPVK